jgi:ribosomal protein L11 methyltransferase
VRRTPAALETVSVEVPEAAVQVYVSALSSVCLTVGFFRGSGANVWRVEGLKPVGRGDEELQAALVLATGVTGTEASVQRAVTPAEGWLARTYASFPELLIGQRFAVRGTHIKHSAPAGRITLTLDAGLAFGSGDHCSTRGCLRALERVARRRPRRILDLGTGSGILAMAAARLLRRRVLATDVEPNSVYVARQNATKNRLGRLVTVQLADGWRHPVVRAGGPYDLVLANILARPLCLMARHMMAQLAFGGTVILSGLLCTQARSVIAAHRHHGVRLDARVNEGAWTTLVLRRPSNRVKTPGAGQAEVCTVEGSNPLI